MTKSFVEFQFTHDIVEFITLFESRNTFSATSTNICMSKWKQSIDVAFINHHSLCIWIIRKNDLRFLCKWYCVIVFRYRCKESLIRVLFHLIDEQIKTNNNRFADSSLVKFCCRLDNGIDKAICFRGSWIVFRFSRQEIFNSERQTKPNRQDKQPFICNNVFPEILLDETGKIDCRFCNNHKYQRFYLLGVVMSIAVAILF